MRRIFLLSTILILSFTQETYAWWTSLYDRGTPMYTYYLGDALLYQFEFAVNQETSPMTVSYGLGKTTDGTGWNWFAATWSRMDGANNRVWISNQNQLTFNSTGSWYYSGRFVWTADGYTEYASGDWAENRTSLSASSYFTVNDLSNPTATSAVTESSSEINLAWTKWNSKDVLIVRKKSTESWTEPTQGASYIVGNSIGSGIVVYKGDASQFNNTGLNSSTTYDFKIYSINNNYYSSGTIVTATTSSASTDYFRSLTSGDWNNAATWQSSNDASFWVNATLTPGVSASSTTIRNGHQVNVVGNETVNTMVINIGGVVEIQSSAKLSITNTLTNNAGNSGLVIKSSATGTGSLIHANSDVPATVQRYIPKYNTLSDHMFHFLSSPVESQAIRTEFVTNPITAGHDFYSWDEINFQWINSKDNAGNWNTSFENNFIIGKGYMVAYPDNVTKNFTGELNSYPNTSPLVINCTHTVGKGNGWNLIGNPFASSIDWDAVIKGDGMDNALYYYDAAEQNYRYYIQLGSIGSLGSGSRYIPPMQGFMVHAKSTGTQTVTINNDHRAHEGQDTWYKTAENEIVSIALKVNNGEFSDESFIHFTPGATPGFDGSYDALKLSSYNNQVPKLYTMSNDDKKLAINGLPELTEGHEIQLYFEPGLTGPLAITAEMNEINTEVFIIDQKTGINHNLSLNPTYSFTSSENDSPNRFLLKFSAVGIEENKAVPAIEAWFSNNQLFVNNPEGVTFVEVVDLTGRSLITTQANGQGLHSLNLIQTPGLYLIRLTSGENTRTIKATIN